MSVQNLLLYFFAGGAVLGGVLMLFLQHPMRVALALIGSMLCLAGIYAMLGVHAIAVFQVLIYVGAVMVFMVYVIMLLDVRDPSFLRRYGHALAPGIAAGALTALALAWAVTRAPSPAAATTDPQGSAFLVAPFSVEFLKAYWLPFELTSVLLLAAVIAAIAVIKGGRRNDGQ
jgi:NADH-quinone oxidoreductase subunit J